MTKEDHLKLLMLISALESWCYSISERNCLPDWLTENIGNSVDKLKDEILEDK